MAVLLHRGAPRMLSLRMRSTALACTASGWRLAAEVVNLLRHSTRNTHSNNVYLS